jgi:hypothetical protein
MAINRKAFVSWGVFGGVGISEDTHVNLFASWGLDGSLPTILTRIENLFTNWWAVWKNRFGGPSTGRTLN